MKTKDKNKITMGENYIPLLKKDNLLLRIRWQALAHSFKQCLPVKITISLFWSSRSLKHSNCSDIDRNNSERISLYRAQCKRTWASDSIEPLLHSVQKRDSAGILVYLPVSRASGATPHLNLANALLCCLEIILCTYNSFSNLFLKSH